MALPYMTAALQAEGPIALVQRFPRVVLTLLCLLLFTPGLTTLPPLDRDESRYSQATKQMLETGDFIEIQFQNEARNKKPVGIYWMQAVSASMLTDAPHTDIWAYRIPSLLGAILAVLLVYSIGARFYDPQTGLVAGAIIASSLLMVVEAHIAKTDAVQLACIVAAQLVIAKFYFDPQEGKPVPLFRWSLLLGAAIGLGILVKGPFTPLVCFLTVATLSVWEGRYKWIWSMRPIVVLFVITLIVLPWLLAIMLVTKGQFLAEAWGRDFAGKIVGSQEGHWGLPGYHLLLLPAGFWPGSLFLIPGIIFAWMTRRNSYTRFLLAWLIPMWVILELTSTKLPHYVLPVYPALALLCAAAVMMAARGGADLMSSLWVKAGIGVWMVVSLGLVFVLLLYVPSQYGSGPGALIYALLLFVLVAVGFAIYFMIRQEPERAVTAALSSGVFLVMVAFGAAVPKLDRLMLSPKAAELAASVGATQNQGERLVIAGYTEPSLVFLAGTKMTLAHDGTKAAEFMMTTPNAYGLIEQAKHDALFRQALSEKGFSAEAVGQVSGLNYSNNDEVTLTLYRLRRVNP
jgi:4-amino-4-deoxy-L-arabinose transferase-like glycosyltransferase